MTPPLSRSRSRRASSHIAVRLAHGVSGGLMAVGWLVLPMEMAGVDHSVPLIRAEHRVAASASAPGEAAPDGGGTSTGDLVLPVVAVGAAGLLAVYAHVRRRRRMRTRTTPGGASVGAASVEEVEARARRSLVETDDSVRTSAEELRAVAAQLGDAAVRPFRAALAYAESELAAAFRLRHRLDDSVAGGGPDTRGMLEEIVARCAEAGRRLDAEAAAFDQTRSLERHAPAVLERTEARFRELTVRASAADITLAGLHERYAPSAAVPVAGHVEQAKDRLVFATSSLNRARQALDRGETERAVVLLRAAEGAVDQAAAFVDGVARLAAELAAAAEKLPAAVAGTETGLAAARGRPDGGAGARADLPGRIARGEAVVAEVRREMSTGVYDPIGALRRIEQAHAGVDAARHHEPDDDEALARLDRSRLTARSATATTSDYVTTHRGAVGYEARTLLAEAVRRLHRAETGRQETGTDDARPEPEGGGQGQQGHRGGAEKGTEAGGAGPGPEAGAVEAGAGLAPVVGLGETREADALARRARQVAERDVRAYGNPYGAGAPAGDGTGGAVLGGILLGRSARHDVAHRASHGPADSGGPTTYSGGPSAYSGGPTTYSGGPTAYSGGPASFGGPRTRGRRDGGELFRPPATD
ncbi:TPM domain-containing protein [Streptomyces avermitilis]|uniref:TPM domain-containing protein n=1 Tax=Streptomyces avermitilis TaxID=33903 RepID=UPI00381FE551